MTGPQTSAGFVSSNRHVKACLGVLCAALWGSALAAVPGADPQRPDIDVAVSLERIREQLETVPTHRLEPGVPVPLAVPTFKSRVDQRVFVPTLEEHLRKEFTLNVLQRQSADWASRCCGLDLAQLAKHTSDALRERRIRKTREQIARELAALDAARKNAAAPK